MCSCVMVRKGRGMRVEVQLVCKASTAHEMAVWGVTADKQQQQQQSPGQVCVRSTVGPAPGGTRA
jgi:hypothetical protein